MNLCLAKIDWKAVWLLVLITISYSKPTKIIITIIKKCSKPTKKKKLKNNNKDTN